MTTILRYAVPSLLVFAGSAGMLHLEPEPAVSEAHSSSLLFAAPADRDPGAAFAISIDIGSTSRLPIRAAPPSSRNR